MDFIQESFLGGINQQFDPTRIAKNQYFLGINVRNRKDVLEPIKLPLDITNKKPEGKIQGLYSASNLLIAFVDGKAFYQDFKINPEVNLIQIRNFQMSSEVDRMYAEFIPSSRFNLYRTKAAGDSNVNGPINLVSGLNVSGSPAALVVQDKINQPYIITAEQGARITQKYSEWKTGINNQEDQREYVPIGGEMLYTNGTLWVNSVDGKEQYRSVIGRPLDFVIAITGITGDKAGDAKTTSIKADFSSVTCLKEIPSGQVTGFFAGTHQASRLVIPGADTLMFDQPLNFRFQYLFPAGPVNQFCFADNNGDSVFITESGIRSFNGTQQLMYESNNDPMSAPVQQMFVDVTQTTPCCCNFDNYILFGVQTVFGASVLVYDTLTKSYCSLDLYPGVSQIKQFAPIQFGGTKRLFFYTEDNKLYEAYASNTTAEAQAYLGEWTSGDPKMDQKGNILRIVLVDAKEAGTVSATIFVDRKKGKTQVEDVEKRVDISTATFPFNNGQSDAVQKFAFTDLEAGAGWKVGYLIKWNCHANLSHVSILTSDQEQHATGMEQASSLYAKYTK